MKLRVATYNIHKGVTGIRRVPRIHDVKLALNCIDADIVFLQECGMTFNERDFVDVGHVKTLYGYDPEGNVIEVQQTAPGNSFALSELKRPV